MNALRLGAILLIVAGTLSLVYGRFSYHRDTQHASMGPMEFSISEQRTVNIPVWAGVGAIVVGVVLLVTRRKNEA